MSTRRISNEDDLYELLSELGETADEVATKLFEAGCKGDRETGYTCPVANYLNSIVGFNACVDGPELWLELGNNEFDSVRLYTRTPTGIAEFVDAFDKGAYPDLERRKSAS